MRILVTGGAGFIASHVTDAYLAAGHQVAVVDNLFHGKREQVPAGAEFFELDIREPSFEDAFESFKPDIVNHHAAQISVRESVNNPSEDASVNILGSIKLIELVIKYKVRKVLFASTGGALYGEQEVYPAPESHPTWPVSPYGAAKLTVEKYLNVFRFIHGLNYVALRYSNVYGPRQDPHGEAGVVAIFAASMWQGKTPTINGTGKQTRDYVFVKDVARANLLALDEKVQGHINIATGIETDVNGIFHHLRESIGADVQEVHGPAMPGEQLRSVLDTSLAKQLMDWQPRVSLKEGMQETAQYFQGRG